jgi:hypothetical protein
VADSAQRIDGRATEPLHGAENSYVGCRNPALAQGTSIPIARKIGLEYLAYWRRLRIERKNAPRILRGALMGYCRGSETVSAHEADGTASLRFTVPGRRRLGLAQDAEPGRSSCHCAEAHSWHQSQGRPVVH